jgi:hypothetical protein
MQFFYADGEKKSRIIAVFLSITENAKSRIKKGEAAGEGGRAGILPFYFKFVC